MPDNPPQTKGSATFAIEKRHNCINYFWSPKFRKYTIFIKLETPMRLKVLVNRLFEENWHQSPRQASKIG